MIALQGGEYANLWESNGVQGYEAIYVLPPGVINANRGRNRQSGAHNDRYDNLVIADYSHPNRTSSSRS